MKKITLIFVLVVFILSIFLVNFMGRPAKSYNATVFVNEIQIDNVAVDAEVAEIMEEGYKNGKYQIKLKFFNNINPEIDSENATRNMIVITPRCIPDNAGNKTFRYSGKSDKAYILDDPNQNHTIVCYNYIRKNPSIFEFTINAGDDHGAKVIVRISGYVDESQLPGNQN